MNRVIWAKMGGQYDRFGDRFLGNFLTDPITDADLKNMADFTRFPIKTDLIGTSLLTSTDF